MRYALTLPILLLCCAALAQTNPLKKGVIVKSNLLNLVAKRPTLTVEKLLSKSFSAEISFVQGRFDNFLFTDTYKYNGFLLRAKKYFIEPDYGEFSPFAALYAGNLKRVIQTAGYIDNTGWISYPSRDFSANSIRGGASAGIIYISKKKIVLESLISLGYGKYVTYYKADRKSNGYLDSQLWLSVGYSF